MKFFQETTVWDGNYPNHIYLLSDDKSKMYAYIRAGTNEHKVFKKPIGFDPRHRTFKDLKMAVPSVKQKPAGREVKGSKGETYYVNDEEGTCTCSGFKYRGTCKHVAEKPQT